jgi:hypothetical protein
MSAQLFLWHAKHDSYIGNAPPGRLQVHGFCCISTASRIGQRVLSEREHNSRHEHQSDSDMRLGWFQHKGIAALMPKLTCRVWDGISLPNSFPLTGSSNRVPSENGGGENCISESAIAHLESSPQSNWWSARTLQCKL